MWQTSFSDLKREAHYLKYCNRHNSKIYSTFILYLIIPMLYLSLKGLFMNGEITDIVKKCICIIFLFYFSIQISSKLLKNNESPTQEEEEMSTAETDSSFEENRNTKHSLANKNNNKYEIFGFKLLDQLFFCFSIIFLYVVQVWIVNPTFFSKYTSNYWFYSGSSIESIRAFLYSSRVKWQYMMSTSLFLNFLLFINFIRLNDNNEVTYFQIIFPFITSNALPFFFYLHEKNFRKIFEENLDYQSKLKSYEKLIRYILPCQLIVLSEEELIFCNEECKKLNNCKTEGELIHKIKSNYVVNEDVHVENIIEHIKKLKDLSSNDFYNFSAKKLDPYTNEIFYFDAKVQKINWQERDSLLLLLHDITALKNLEKMKEIDAYKDQLLATVSHDLRTPLHGIMGILEMSLEKVYDNFLKTDLNIALKTSKLLLFMINDILDYSQINKGKLGLVFCKTNLHSIVDEVFNIVKFQAEKKGLRLLCNFPEKMRNIALYTDPRRLQQILLNLLSNAIKFTLKGEVILTVSVIHKGRVHFSVTDTGIGISDVAQSKLFNFYSKLNNHIVNKESIGLGLVICKHLLNSLCQNDIKMRSQLGIGSVFEFEVPYEEEEEDINEEKVAGEFGNRRMEAYESGRRKKNGLKVLIVEDDQICLLVMCK